VNTRHHSVESHLYHPHAVYYDKYVNALSTRIVAITDLVADVLIKQENVDPAKVRVIRHGFDLKQFEEALARNGDLKEKYGLTSDYPVIGVISRHIHWKGVQYIIPAFQELLKKYANAKLVLANAAGSYQPELLKLLEPIDNSRYVLIPFEQNVLDLYKSFDVFVHVPIGKDYEAFGQTYIEALAMKVPSVFTLSGVANDFIRDGYNAAVVPYENSDAIVRAVNSILSSDEYRASLNQNGYDSVRSEFHVDRMLNELDTIYHLGSGN
jgi:glycosyltransferase involved in cell wall biosynthesis